TQRVPVVVYGLLAANVLMFLVQHVNPNLVFEYGFKPTLFFAALHGVEAVAVPRGPHAGSVWIEPSFSSAYLPFLVSMFLHGGIFHIGFNMLFLWIFADNVEDQLGHGRFLFFYLACGILATLAHAFMEAGSGIPTIGASGAVAGVLGAYFLRFPRARILTLIPIFIFIHVVEVPALVFLGIWFALEIFQALTATGGNVAVWAHAGGFVAGMALFLLLKVGAPPAPRRPHRQVRYRVIR
ncbi:MAG: rhomboid family intramembrane serine protease, partial [Planctomycetota bacterium]